MLSSSGSRARRRRHGLIARQADLLRAVGREQVRDELRGIGSRVGARHRDRPRGVVGQDLAAQHPQRLCPIGSHGVRRRAKEAHVGIGRVLHDDAQHGFGRVAMSIVGRLRPAVPLAPDEELSHGQAVGQFHRQALWGQRQPSLEPLVADVEQDRGVVRQERRQVLSDLDHVCHPLLQRTGPELVVVAVVALPPVRRGGDDAVHRHVRDERAGVVDPEGDHCSPRATAEVTMRTTSLRDSGRP